MLAIGDRPLLIFIPCLSCTAVARPWCPSRGIGLSTGKLQEPGFYQVQDYIPPQALLEFIHASALPICIGFGSMPYHRAGELTRIVLQALEQSG